MEFLEESRKPADIAKKYALRAIRFAIPPLSWLPKYQLSNLKLDIPAGFIVGIILVPQSIAYANLARIPVQYGLFSSATTALAYAFFGTVPTLSVGPVAELTTVMIGAPGLPANFGNDRAQALAAITLQAAVIGIVLSMFRGGMWIRTLMSTTVGSAYTLAQAITLFVVQVKGAIGVKGGSRVMLHEAAEDLRYAIERTGDTNSLYISLMSLGMISYLVLVKKVKWMPPWIPHQLVVLVTATLLTKYLELDKRIGLAIVKDVTVDALSISLPSQDNIAATLPTAIVVTLLGFLQSYNIAIRFGSVDADRELFAGGACAFVSSLFGGLPACGSLARSAVLVDRRGQSVVTSLAAALVVIFTLVVLTPFGVFYHVPNNCLSAIIIAAILKLMDPSELILLWSVSKGDFFVYLATLIMCLFTGVTVGVLAGIALSVGLVLWNVARPRHAELGLVDERGQLLDIAADDELLVYPRVLVWDFDAPLYFININYFAEELLETVRLAGRPINVVIVNCAHILAIDSVAARELPRIVRQMSTAIPKDRGGLRVFFAGFNESAQATLLRVAEASDGQKIDPAIIFSTVDEALHVAQRCVARTVHYVDKEEDTPRPIINYAEGRAKTGHLRLGKGGQHNAGVFGISKVPVGIVSVVRNAERTPKQKCKVRTADRALVSFLSTATTEDRDGDEHGRRLPLTPENRQLLLSHLRRLLSFHSVALVGQGGNAQPTGQQSHALAQGPHEGIESLQLAVVVVARLPTGLRVQFKLDKDKPDKSAASFVSPALPMSVLSRTRDDDHEAFGNTLVSQKSGGGGSGVFGADAPTGVVILKWGGLITDLGLRQAEVLGKSLAVRNAAFGACCEGESGTPDSKKLPRNPLGGDANGANVGGYGTCSAMSLVRVTCNSEERVRTSAIAVAQAMPESSHFREDTIIVNDAMLGNVGSARAFIKGAAQTAKAIFNIRTRRELLPFLSHASVRALFNHSDSPGGTPYSMLLLVQQHVENLLRLRWPVGTRFADDETGAAFHDRWLQLARDLGGPQAPAEPGEPRSPTSPRTPRSSSSLPPTPRAKQPAFPSTPPLAPAAPPSNGSSASFADTTPGPLASATPAAGGPRPEGGTTTPRNAQTRGSFNRGSSTGEFDASVVTSLHECAMYDHRHNRVTLEAAGFDIGPLLRLLRLLDAVWSDLEYGSSQSERFIIGSLLAHGLIDQLCTDLEEIACNVLEGRVQEEEAQQAAAKRRAERRKAAPLSALCAGDDDVEEMVPPAGGGCGGDNGGCGDPAACGSGGAGSPSNDKQNLLATTRLYFTGESHVTALRHCLFDNFSSLRGLKEPRRVSRKSKFMTHILFRLFYLDDGKPLPPDVVAAIKGTAANGDKHGGALPPGAVAVAVAPPPSPGVPASEHDANDVDAAVAEEELPAPRRDAHPLLHGKFEVELFFSDGETTRIGTWSNAMRQHVAAIFAVGSDVGSRLNAWISWRAYVVWRHAGETLDAHHTQQVEGSIPLPRSPVVLPSPTPSVRASSTPISRSLQLPAGEAAVSQEAPPTNSPRAILTRQPSLSFAATKNVSGQAGRGRGAPLPVPPAEEQPLAPALSLANVAPMVRIRTSLDLASLCRLRDEVKAIVQTIDDETSEEATAPAQPERLSARAPSIRSEREKHHGVTNTPPGCVKTEGTPEVSPAMQPCNPWLPIDV